MTLRLGMPETTAILEGSKQAPIKLKTEKSGSESFRRVSFAMISKRGKAFQ